MQREIDLRKENTGDLGEEKVRKMGWVGENWEKRGRFTMKKKDAVFTQKKLKWMF